ncbi:MAG TPA: tol-pal system-associated acyl-CoA thioesterase [Sphingomonadales bacterium]|nr:tol-pal system-associated acyl-CoA thioesterase [Sphingomonadales bacterium]
MREPARLQPAAGELAGKRHRMAMRVYWEDTDAGGIVYHANYLKYMERARTDFLRLLGIEQTELMADPATSIKFAVKSLDIDYHQPARLDDALVIETEVRELKAASIVMAQAIRRGETPIADARFRVAVLNAKGAPTRLPKTLVEIFRKLK